MMEDAPSFWGTPAAPGLFDVPEDTPGTPPMREDTDKQIKYNYTVHYQVFNATYDGESKAKLEEVMTEIMNGKLLLLHEDKTFTREGDYLVALKWAEVAEV